LSNFRFHIDPFPSLLRRNPIFGFTIVGAMTEKRASIPNTGPALILVLGDQLSLGLAGLKAGRRTNDVVLMVEAIEEATYVRHHKKKIAFILSAMRHFADELAEAGWTVDYVRLDDRDNRGSLVGELEHAVSRHNAAHVGCH